MPTVTFYHSVICPRCQMAGRSLSQLLDEFPDVTVEKVEYLANLGRSRRDGVRAIPTLVSGERRLSGFYLGKGSIRRFLESL
jgi:glutaredoxin